MTTIYELIKAYGKTGDEVLKSVATVSEAVERDMPAEARERLLASLYGTLSSGHFNEAFAKEAVEKMHYAAKDGAKKRGPFIAEDKARELYEEAKADIPTEYNFWDFFVTLNMSVADYHGLVGAWFAEETAEEREKRYVELATNWLADEDSPYGESKIWGYLNAPKK